jgi:F0F1-type ATP synthase epsilon subunit
MAARTFHLTIARVGENLFDGEAVSAALPGAEGAFEVLAGHEPLVSRLGEGRVRVKAADGESYHFDIEAGGIAEVSGGEATVLL